MTLSIAFRNPVDATDCACLPGVLNVISGPNGAGKSRLLDVLSGYSSNRDHAQVIRHGHSAPRDVAYLPQHLFSLADIPVESLKQLARTSSIPNGPPLDGIYVLSQLSGGQQQHLLFRLLAAQPKLVYLCDEPFRHLDTGTVTALFQVLRGLVDTGKLVVITDNEGVLSSCPIPIRLAAYLGIRSATPVAEGPCDRPLR